MRSKGIAGVRCAMRQHRAVPALVVLQAFEELVEHRVAEVRLVEVALRLHACRRDRQRLVHAQEVRDVRVVRKRLAPAFVFVDAELGGQQVGHRVGVGDHHVGAHQQFKHVDS
jgi:hypothetical protein